MTSPFEDLAGLDKLIHEPARLAIVTALASCETADFLYLQRLTGLSKGNLSAHLSKLETAGLVHIRKQFVGKTPQTVAALTEAGQEAVAEYWQQLTALRSRARRWQAES
jgi:DNA-binding transcriptional ArsR family regulator